MDTCSFNEKISYETSKFMILFIMDCWPFYESIPYRQNHGRPFTSKNARFFPLLIINDYSRGHGYVFFMIKIEFF